MRNCRAICFALCAVAGMAVSLQAQSDTASDKIRVADTELSWAMTKQVVLDTLRKNPNNLVAKGDNDSESLVLDRERKQISAILRFDGKGRLLEVQRNWTPVSDHSDEFAKSLYNLVSQRELGDCRVVAAHHADPGQDIEEVILGCEKAGIRITRTQSEIGQTRFSTVTLYEMITRPE